MSITIELQPEQQERITTEAKKQGLSAAEYVRRLTLSESLIAQGSDGTAMLAGTSLRVSLVAAMHREQGHSAQEIAETVFPHLSLDAVQAALDYAQRHRAEIDAELDAERRLVAEMRANSKQNSREELLRRLKERQTA